MNEIELLTQAVKALGPWIIVLVAWAELRVLPIARRIEARMNAIARRLGLPDDPPDGSGGAAIAAEVTHLLGAIEAPPPASPPQASAPSRGS